MQGMMRLYARNVILFDTYCCTRPILLENFALTANLNFYGKTCLFFLYFLVLAVCLVFLPMVLGNFLRGRLSHENSKK